MNRVHSAASGSIPRQSDLSVIAELQAWRLSGSKYSPNLKRWCRKQAAHDNRVYRGKDGALWIGWIDDGLWFIGSRFWRVMCLGAKAEVGCWTFPVSDLTEVKGFWGEYARIGRCAIDKDHERHFVEGAGRWTEDGDVRTCKWCGHTQNRRTWTESVVRQKWESADGVTRKRDEAEGGVNPKGAEA